MGMLEKVQRGKVMMKPRLWLYGEVGIGKSTAASEALAPIFVQTERRLDAVGPDRVNCRTFNEVVAMLTELAETPHNYSTVVIDTVDSLEQMVHLHICEEAGVTRLEEIDGGFGKWAKRAAAAWYGLKDQLENLWSHKDRPMTVVLLSHAIADSIADPTMDTYMRWQPNVRRAKKNDTGALDILAAWVDVIGYVRKSVILVESKEGFNHTRVRADGGDAREVVYEASLAVFAKNCGMTAVQPFEKGKSWATFAAEYAAARKANQGAKNADAAK